MEATICLKPLSYYPKVMGGTSEGIHPVYQREYVRRVTMPEKLTYEDVNSIKYFIQEKGDIERWSGWEKMKPLVEDQLPEVIAALNNLKIAERTLEAVINSMEYSVEDF